MLGWDHGAGVVDRGEGRGGVAVDGCGVRVHGYEHLADVGCGDDIGYTLVLEVCGG